MNSKIMEKIEYWEYVAEVENKKIKDIMVNINNYLATKPNEYGMVGIGNDIQKLQDTINRRDTASEKCQLLKSLL